jgi:truncated hemoglobin YjbI
VKNVSLFDRLGGDFTVDFLVQSFVDKLHSNKKLKPLLAGKNVKVVFVLQIRPT